jgi:hypothetical protein
MHASFGAKEFKRMQQAMQFTHNTIRLLGVHGLAVYMLMLCAEQDGIVPVTHHWIWDHMPEKTSPNTITTILRRLTDPEYQIAVRVKGGWRLNREHAFQLPLSYELSDENHSESDSVATTTTTTMEERNSDKSVVVVKRRENHSESDSVIYETPGVTFEKNLKACRDNNIGEPKASRISEMPWVSPDFIKAHVESLYASDVVGLAIRRIEGNELPRVWKEATTVRDGLDDKIARLRARDNDNQEDEDE